MKNIIERIVGGVKIARYLPKAVSTRLAVAALAALAAGGTWAATDKTNPVTDKNQSYTYNYTGSGTWTASDWSPTPSNVPQASGSGVWDSLLIDGDLTVTAPSHVEGWSFRIGLFGKAKLTVPYIRYWNGTAYAVVDTGSKLTIQSINTSDNWNATVNYYVAAAGGITYTCAFNPTVTANAIYNYNLKGAGSVVYELAVSRGSHVIKQADVTLSGNATPSVESKMLVSFGSGTTATFTADAAIKVYGTDGTTLVETVNLAEVKTAPTLTADDPVGSCELVQTSTGVVLKYVDGDPSAVVAKTYTPSININFCFGNAPLTTAADVGYGDYAVPGTSWNNMTSTSPASGNGTFTTPLSTVYAVKADGTSSLVSGASVALSGTPGSYKCSSLAAATDLRHGYIDENANNTAPTVTISGIPYDQYKVVVYTSTDTANSAFGYVSVNGTDYTYVNNELANGTTAWGASGASDSANAIAEGVNMLVTPAISGATATIVGHKSNGRGCIAAVQIVKVAQQVGENDLLIELDGDRTYTFDEAKTYSGTVYVTGSGTLTFAGTASTAATLHIGPFAAVNMNGSTLTPSAVTGTGTVVYDGAQPSTTVGFDDSANWHGTVWVKNIGSNGESSKVSTVLGTDTATATGNVLKDWGNENSSVKFTNVRGWTGTAVCPWTLILEDDSTNYAWYNNNGYAARSTTFAALKGSGTFYDKSVDNKPCRQKITFTDGSQFTGALYAEGKRVGLGGENTRGDAEDNNGTIEVVSGATATVASGKTWTAGTGSILVTGTLYANGTLAGTSTTRAVRGSGTVVFTGRAPTPTGDAWWKNASWTGTVWIKSHAIVELDTNLYGNEGSTLKFTGVTGYFAQNHVNTVPIELENNGSTAAFNYNNGWGGELLTFSELKGTGTLQTSSAGDGGTIWVKKWDAFTGVMNLGKKQVVMGGSEPAHSNVNRGGKLVIAEGAVVTNLNATTSWTASKGIEVNGTFAASDRTAWADGTAMTINSTGILNMYGSGVNDTSKSFANVTGTGTIWYSQTTTENNKWSALPSSAANMFANTLSVSNDNVNAGVIITMNGASDVITTNANISGTGYFRSDWDEGAYRGFLALQSKNTTWSGTFGSSSRIKKFIVAGVDGATDRTLTLAGTQSSTIPLTVESLGSVNIPGTYLGATTVSGTFGGTGTLTGDLTFNAGSTFKAFASDTDGLAVSGTITYPSEGTVTVDVSALEQTGTKVLMTASGLDVSKFALASGQSGELLVEGNALKVDLTTYAASYGGTKYPTVQEAINAAVQAGQTYADVTILDPNATCPAGYYIDTEDNNVLKKYAAAAVTVVGATATTNGFTTFQAAIDAAVANSTTYAVAYADGTAQVDATKMFMLQPAGFNVSVTCSIAGYGAYAQGIEIPGFAGVYQYNTSPVAATFTWTGAAEDGGLWETAGNWSSEDGTVAAAPANSLYTAVLDTAATIKLAGVVAIGTVNVGAAVTLNHVFGQNATLDASSIVLTAAGASLAKHDDQNSMTLVVVPTTTVANSYVKTTTSGGTTTYTVATQPTVSDVAFDYGADYASATVTATVSDTTLDYYISWASGEPVKGSVSGSQVTFDVSGINHTTGYQSAGYTITAKDGETAVTTTGGSGTTVAADTTPWFSQSSANSGAPVNGLWTTAVNLTEPATVEDNTFTATAESTSSRVVLEFNVCFSSASDADVDGTAQAAIKIGEVESAATFMVLAPNNEWTAVSNEGLTPDAAKTYKVVMTIDYGGSGSYGVAVDNYVMTDASGSASFPLAANKKSVQTIGFAGSGTLTSMKGDQVEGYMVVDNNGTRYPTIAAAIAAYNANPTIGPLKVLHAGTAPSGWSIVSEGGIAILKKLAKGFFFMAY